MRSRWLLSLVLLVSPTLLHAQTAPSVSNRTLSVFGAADVKVQPDHVILTLGVETRNAKLEAAKLDNDQRVRRVLGFLRDSGIQAADIQTDYVSIEPSYDWDRPTVVQHFSVQKTIVVTLRDPAKFEAVLAGSVSRGITNVLGVAFRTSELKRHRETARAMAVKAALEKARKLAAEVGGRPGKVLSLQDNSWGGWSSWSPGGWNNRWGGGGAQANVSVQASGGSGSSDDLPPTLALGEIVVSASVQMILQLE